LEDWVKDIEIEDLDEPYYQIAEKMGIKVALEMAKMFQGSQVYFPKVETSCNPKRKQLIKEEFNGYNYRELAEKYGFTERWVREICKDQVERERNKPPENQLSLFDSVE
jgi:Mor family transcriptional regulator